MSYFLANDGNGELTLWSDNLGNPHAVSRRCDVDGELWQLAMRGVGIDEDVSCNEIHCDDSCRTAAQEATR